MTQGWEQRPGVWREAKCGGQCSAADIMNSKDKLCVVFVRGQCMGHATGMVVTWQYPTLLLTGVYGSSSCRPAECSSPCMHAWPRRWERDRSSSLTIKTFRPIQ